MINNNLIFVLIFWGTWLVIPVLVDGGATLWRLVAAFRFNRQSPPLPPDDLPRVSIIIPAYNEKNNIETCLLGVQAQTYPHRLLEVIVIDDGSDDGTSGMVLKFLGANSGGYHAAERFGGVINLVRLKRDEVARHGKPYALNAGLALVTGAIVVTLDSDVVLEPDAIEQAVRVFLADPTLTAATGHLIIDPDLVHEKDSDGHAKLDERGLPIARQLTLSEHILTACEFLEYVTSFHLGRRSESIVDSMFTVAGACTIFRAEALAQHAQYRGRTVCEDTDMTLLLHALPNARVGYLENTRVHLAPVLTWAKLYSQRVRWQRGALEASAINLFEQRKKKTQNWLFWKLALPLRLQIDHTLAIPRIAWMMMIWLLPLFGYSLNIIIDALALMILFYMLVNTVQTLVVYLLASAPEKVYIRKYIRYIPLWGAYNLFLFGVRMSAICRTLTEEAAWTVQSPILIALETMNLRQVMSLAIDSFLTLFL